MDTSEIEALLKPRVEQPLLTGYFWGKFSTQKDKFQAATCVDISTIEYDDYEWLHKQLESSSAAYFDEERKRHYYDNGSFSYKGSTECVAEGIYKYFAITFTGIYFENKWYILKELCFYGDKIDINGIKQNLITRSDTAGFWEQSAFKPYQSITREVNGQQVEMRNIGIEDFSGNPYLVAILKQRKKENVNHPYTQYFNEEFIIPFFDKLRIQNPDKYTAFGMLRFNYTMIFPEHKKYCIFCAMVQNSYNVSKLNYFVYDILERNFHQWIYFKARTFSFNCFYGELIINDLKQISDWNDLAFLDSSRTLDDVDFWDKYVFAKQDNKFLYLQEV